MPKKQPSDRLNIDQLAEMFGLPSAEDIDERNVDYVAEAGSYAYKDAIESEDTEDEAETAREKAEHQAQAEVYGNWYDAVEHAASGLFGEHALELTPVGKGDRPYEFKIMPGTSWDAAANKIRATINGVGYFQFDSLREFLDSGPYTARQAVLAHLGHIKNYSEVYGTASARAIYEQSWR